MFARQIECSSARVPVQNARRRRRPAARLRLALTSPAAFHIRNCGCPAQSRAQARADSQRPWTVLQAPVRPLAPGRRGRCQRGSRGRPGSPVLAKFRRATNLSNAGNKVRRRSLNGTPESDQFFDHGPPASHRSNLAVGLQSRRDPGRRDSQAEGRGVRRGPVRKRQPSTVEAPNQRQGSVGGGSHQEGRRAAR